MTPEASTLVLRLSVPANGHFRTVVADLAVKVAEYLGQETSDAKSTVEIVETLAAEVVPRDSEGAEVTFEFHQTDEEWWIDVRCAGRSSQARRQMPT
jgi:hypothetical protein